jgi:hypothetical protein
LFAGEATPGNSALPSRAPKNLHDTQPPRQALKAAPRILRPTAWFIPAQGNALGS